MKRLLLILIAVLLFSCVPAQDWNTVKVRAGNHYPNKFFCPDRSLRAEADIILHEDCWYDRTPYNGLNKLSGISGLFVSVHKNSARFVWIPSTSQDSIDIYYYIYVNKISPQQNQNQKGFIKRVKTGDSHRYKVLDYLNKYEFYINGELLKTYPTYKRRRYFLSLAYYHNLYVGGTFTLPFDVNVSYIIHY